MARKTPVSSVHQLHVETPTADACYTRAANLLVQAEWEAGHPEKAAALTGIADSWTHLGTNIRSE